MPRMPSEDDLSFQLPNSRRALQGPRDFIGPAVANVGQTIQREGEADRDLSMSISRREKGERDSLDLARARADWQTRRANEVSLYTYDQDQNYGTWKQRYDKNILKHRDQSAALISSPRIKRRFEVDTDGDIAESGLDITTRARGIDRGKRKAEGLVAIDQQMNVAATLPKGQSEKVIGEVRANIDNMTFSGLLTPEEGVLKRQSVTEGYATVKAQQDVENNPERASTWLSDDGTTDGTEKLIMESEGFRSAPYMDKGSLRIGHGSDTITMADGRVIKVTKGMRVSRADAARDLHRRKAEFQDVIIKDVGTDAWAQLPESAKAGLTDFAYNYGSLTPSVAAAVKSGDVHAIADAVRSRGVDNDGINAQRRAKEAAVIEGSAGNVYAELGRPDYYDFLPVGERLRLQSHADAEVARRDKERDDATALAQYSLKEDIDNDVRQIAETGVASNIDPSTVVNTLGATDAAKWLDRRKTAAQTYAETSKLDTMSDNEIAAHLDELEPKAGHPDFDRAQTVYDATEKKAKKLTDLRLKDPALSVEDSPIVKKAAENFNPENPVGVQALVRARLAAQDAVDIPQALRQPITRAEARKIIAPIQSTIDMMDSSVVAAIGAGKGDAGARRAAVKAVRAESERQIRETVESIEGTYGEFAPRVLAFAISESVRDKQIGDLATSVLRKIAKGDKATIVDMHSLESANETSVAEKAMSGTLPPPKASAPPAAGQQPDRTASIAARSPGSKPAFPDPSREAVQFLMANPDTAPQFDRAYGPGSAKMWMPKTGAR